MSVTELERDVLGEPVSNPTRALAGFAASVGLAGHVGLALAALAYVLAAPVL